MQCCSSIASLAASDKGADSGSENLDVYFTQLLSLTTDTLEQSQLPWLILHCWMAFVIVIDIVRSLGHTQQRA